MNRRAAILTALLLAGCAPSAPVEAPAPAPTAAANADTVRAVSPPATYPTTPPRPGPAPTVRVPAPVRRTLPNGLTVLYVQRTELPTVQATLVTRGGQTDDPAERPGLASFTANMLDEGAGGKNALELADALDALGATLVTGASWDAAQVSLYSLRSRLPQALGLMADVVVRPDFPANEVARIRDQTVTELTRARDNPGVVASRAFPALVYGSRHPYGRLASTAGVRGLDRQALSSFHRRFYRPGSSTLVLVGDVDPATVHPLVERAFGSWAAGTAPGLPTLAAPTVAGTRIYLIDKPGAAQSEIRIGHPGVARSHPDYFPLVVLNTLLGGSFTSRLNQNLREAHGYTYGAGSSFAMRRGAGPFTASAAVVTAKTDSALIEFFRELNRIRSEPVPAEELERAKNFLALGLPRQIETNASLAGTLADLAVHGLDASFYDTYVQRIMAVTPDDVRRVANQHVRPGQAVVVVVGDRSVIQPGIQAAGIAAVELREIGEFVQ